MSWGAIEAQIRAQMIAAMNSARNVSETILNDNVANFYSGGSPIMYQRLDLLMSSPHVTRLAFGGNTVSFDAYMEPIEHPMPPGTFDGQTILEVTEAGTAGVVGTPGYWAKSEAKFQSILDASMGAYFG